MTVRLGDGRQRSKKKSSPFIMFMILPEFSTADVKGLKYVINVNKQYHVTCCYSRNANNTTSKYMHTGY